MRPAEVVDPARRPVLRRTRGVEKREHGEGDDHRSDDEHEGRDEECPPPAQLQELLRGNESRYAAYFSKVSGVYVEWLP